jgi:hypothetical protein
VLKTDSDIDEASALLYVSKGLGPTAIVIAGGRVHCACETVNLAQRLIGGIVERGEERGFLFAAAEAPLGEVSAWPDAPLRAATRPQRLCLLGTDLRQGFTAMAACDAFLAFGDKAGNVWLAAAAAARPSESTSGPAAPAPAAAEADVSSGWETFLATTHWQGKRVTGVCLNGRAGWVLSGSLDGTLHVCRLRRPPPAAAGGSAGEAGAGRVAEAVAPAGVTAVALVGEVSGDERRAVVGCYNGALCTVDMTGLPKLTVQVLLAEMPPPIYSYANRGRQAGRQTDRPAWPSLPNLSMQVLHWKTFNSFTASRYMQDRAGTYLQIHLNPASSE